MERYYIHRLEYSILWRLQSQQLVYILSAIWIKIIESFFSVEFDRLFLKYKYMWKCKGLIIANTVLRFFFLMAGAELLAIKLYYKSIVIKYVLLA